MAKRNKTLSIVVIAVFAAVALLAVASEYMLHYALSSNKQQFNAETEFANFNSNYPQLAMWCDSIRNDENGLQEWAIKNRNGYELKALYIPSPTHSHNVAIVIHGYKNNPIGMLHIASIYNRYLKYAVVLPSLFAHAYSEGDVIQMGWFDRLDIKEWMNKANMEVGGIETMAVHGISMGAATTMMLSGEQDLPEYVKVFIEDCGYTSVWDEFSNEMKARFSLPKFPIMYSASQLNKIQNGWSFSEASSIEQVKKCNKPMLFIHGDADTFVRTEMVYPLFEAKSGVKELWITKGTKHALSYKDYPQEYIKKVVDFVSKNTEN